MVYISEIIEGRVPEGTETDIRGWIHRTRSSGKLSFVVIRDSTDIIQVTVRKGNVPDEDFEAAKNALVESSVMIKGKVKKDERAPGGYELQASSFKVFHYSEVYPITKDQSDEFLLDQRHLWLRSTEMQATLRIRSAVFNALRTWFYGHGFNEVQSPTFVSGACEGGSTLFEVPFFKERKVYLSQSWQLYAEAMVMSLDKIFTIAPSFRAEKSRTRRHLAEFWHCEAEVAWIGNDEMMALEEDLIPFVVQSIIKNNRRDLEKLNRDISKLEKCQKPFERIRYEKAEELLATKGVAPATPGDLGYEEEKVLTEFFDRPFFVTHFPKKAKAFYHRPDPTNPNVVLCHDLLAPEGYGEIIGGGERIYDKEQLLARMKEEGLDTEPYNWYIDLRRFGTVPHSGFGCGVDRLVTWITGQSHIKYVIPFPRMMRRVYP
jgi:asparaginyl-tRNA synthetase